jgi:hypothetical protein
MSKKQEALRAELHKVLNRGGRSIINRASDSKVVPVPEKADVFEFDFTKEGKTYGKVFVSIDGLRQLIVYFDDAVSGSPKNGSTDSESWEQLIKTLKRFSMMKQLSFKLDNIDNLENDMAKREHTKREEQMYEGYHAQGKKASYSDNVPTTKIIIKHKREMQEGEQRFRQIDKIFIENAIGERMLAPTDRPGLARVFARHVAEGGKANDDRWNHISSLCEEYKQMAGFVRATRSGQFNESAQQLVSEGINHYQKLRECLGKMSGQRGYNAYFESYTPALMEDEEQVDLSEMFMSSSLDPRIESVMPILRKLSKNITETSDMAETIALEAWADDIIGTHKGGTTTHKDGVTRHKAGPGVYGGSEPEEDPDTELDKNYINKTEKEIGVKWPREKKFQGGIKVDEVESSTSGKPSRQDVAKKMHGILSKSVNKSNMARVKTQQAVGSRVADIGAGGKEYNVKTDAAWDKQQGVTEDSFDNPVSNAITRRILMQRSDLLAKYGPEKVTAAIDDVADFVGDTDEIGSSDVSGWVKQVEKSLAGMGESETNEGVLDAVRNKMQSGSMLDRVRSGAYKKPAAPVAQAAPTAPAAAPPPGYDTETGKPLPPEARFDPNTGKPLPGLSPAAPVATRPPLPSAQAAATPRPPATATPTAPQPAMGPTELPPDWKFGQAIPRSVWKAGDDPNKNPNNPIIVTMVKTRDALVKQGRGNPDEIQHSITRANRGQEFNTYGMTGYVDESKNVLEGLSSNQRSRLDDLISQYRDATDPMGYDDDAPDPDEVINQIRQEFGDKIADTLEQGPSSHFTRNNHSIGNDPLDSYGSTNRITKLGKVNKQDISALKNRIKQRDVTEGQKDLDAIKRLLGK